MTTRLDAAAIRQALDAIASVETRAAWSAGDAIRVVDSTGSTNADLLEPARRALRETALRVPSAHRQFLGAIEQTAGRGRHGRDWIAGNGNLTFSIGMTLDLTPARLGGFALLAGLAVREALASMQVDVALKWPNDLVDRDGAKLGGLLVEIVSVAPAGPVWLVLGIGLNRALNDEAKQRLAERVVTDLATLGAGALDVNQLVARIIDALETRLPAFATQGFAPFREPFDRVHLYQQRMVTLSDGHRVWHGRFAGTGVNGEAHLARDGAVVEAHLSGELSLRAATA